MQIRHLFDNIVADMFGVIVSLCLLSSQMNFKFARNLHPVDKVIDILDIQILTYRISILKEDAQTITTLLVMLGISSVDFIIRLSRLEKGWLVLRHVGKFAVTKDHVPDHVSSHFYASPCNVRLRLGAVSPLPWIHM